MTIPVLGNSDKNAKYVKYLLFSASNHQTVTVNKDVTRLGLKTDDKSLEANINSANLNKLPELTSIAKGCICLLE